MQRKHNLEPLAIESSVNRPVSVPLNALTKIYNHYPRLKPTPGWPVRGAGLLLEPWGQRNNFGRQCVEKLLRRQVERGGRMGVMLGHSVLRRSKEWDDSRDAGRVRLNN